MQPWSHLPNASRIDQLLTHAKANPKEWVVASDAAYYAAVALVAWDHSGSLLDLLPDQVLMLSKLGQPAAILMYPAVLAMSDKG